jgi:hypothetical protein
MSVDDANRGNGSSKPSAANNGSVESSGTSDPAQDSSVLNGESQEEHSRRSQILNLSWLNKKSIIAILSSMALVASALANINDVTDLGGRILNVATTQGATPEIKELLRSHYEEVGDQKYKEAFADFGKIEQERLGGLESYKGANANWCPAVDANVGEPEVNQIIGDKATATVSVHYEHKCGESPDKFGSQAKYVWHLSKVNGEWKLEERDQETVDPVYAHYPSEIGNGGPTYSDLSRGAERGSMDTVSSVRASNTALATSDACGDTYTYEPANAADRNPKTAWQVAGTGTGQWIELKYDKPIRADRVGIIPGYAKIDSCDGTDRFYQRYVVQRAEIQFSDESNVIADFERKPKMQFVDVPNIETTSVRVTILASYSPKLHHPDGSTYPLLVGVAAISEIQVEKDEQG